MSNICWRAGWGVDVGSVLDHIRSDTEFKYGLVLTDAFAILHHNNVLSTVIQLKVYHVGFMLGSILNLNYFLNNFNHPP